MLLNMKDLLAVADANKFAIPAFNIASYSMFNAVMEAVEETQSPVIIAIHPVELNHLGEEVLRAIREKAFKSSVPVCIHMDHGSSIEEVMKAIKSGYTSVMIDGSRLSFEDNIALCKEVVKLAHPIDISVEGELGTIGTTDSTTEYVSDDIIFSKPEDVATFVAETGVDTLAIAIGTSHGLYPAGKKPHLRLDILKEIKSKVSIPLVLHGGSSNADEEISEAVVLGVSKINISSDIKAAYFNKMREVLQDKGLREPDAIEPPCMKALKEVAIQKIELFKADGKARLY